MLISCCYAPGLSRYNHIEHLWSPCSKWLVGVSLPACLPGENTPKPLYTKDEYAEKEKEVSSTALDFLSTNWDGRIHDGFKAPLCQ